jgi:hypothetical protein
MALMWWHRLTLFWALLYERIDYGEDDGKWPWRQARLRPSVAWEVACCVHPACDYVRGRR